MYSKISLGFSPLRGPVSFDASPFLFVGCPPPPLPSLLFAPEVFIAVLSLGFHRMYNLCFLEFFLCCRARLNFSLFLIW